jgi:Flp pilus assembly protein TadB
MGCSACGGQFPIARLEATIVCPFCAQRQPVPEALRRELAGYRDEFAAEQLPADEAARQAQSWRDLARAQRRAPAGTLWIVQAALVLPVLLAVGIAKLSPSSSALVPVLAGAALFLVLGGLLVVGRRHAARAGSRRAPPARAKLGIHQISCPSCGAPNAYDARREATSCGHCGGALFPTAELIGRSLEAARSGRRAAVLERHRAERAGTAQLALDARKRRAGGWRRYRVLLGASAAAAAIIAAMAADPAWPYPAVLPLLWGLLPLPLLHAGWRIRRERALRERLEAALGLVARQMRGEADDDVEAYVGWLNRHWAGAYQVPYTDLGSWFHSVRGVASGDGAAYPALIEVNLDPDAATGCSVGVLLASAVPGANDESRALTVGALPHAARPWFNELLGLGWSVHFSSAGLHARMDLERGAGRRLLAAPESATALTGVLARLAALCRGLTADSRSA